jgi:hypothetical protein
MKIETSPIGSYVKAGIRYRILSEEGESVSLFAQANGYEIDLLPTQAKKDILAEQNAQKKAEAAARVVPRQITAWQAKAALALVPVGTGTLLDAANAAIEGMPEGPQKIVVHSAWNNNANFERNSPTILAFGVTLGLDSEALDNLFRQGAALSV